DAVICIEVCFDLLASVTFICVSRYRWCSCFRSWCRTVLVRHLGRWPCWWWAQLFLWRVRCVPTFVLWQSRVGVVGTGCACSTTSRWLCVGVLLSCHGDDGRGL